jgi:dipeptide/tripeptide permease
VLGCADTKRQQEFSLCVCGLKICSELAPQATSSLLGFVRWRFAFGALPLCASRCFFAFALRVRGYKTPSFVESPFAAESNAAE